jgi:hypothetical protein
MDFANVESDDPANRRSRPVAAPGANKKIARDKFKGNSFYVASRIIQGRELKLFEICDK